MLRKITHGTALLLLSSSLIPTALARQVEGQPTLPSDCTADEVWVRDHSKVTGEWTSFCRTRTGRSRSRSYDFWAPRFKPGIPPDWPFDEHATDWKSKDVQDILWTIDRVPEALWVPQLKGIYRMNRSKDHPNPGIYLDGSMVLYDPAFQNEEYTARIFSHELAHAKFSNYSDTQKETYAISAGWKKRRTATGARWWEPPKNVVRSINSESRDEDFANNLEFYLFEPETLKKANPGAFRWIQNNFGRDFRFEVKP